MAPPSMLCDTFMIYFIITDLPPILVPRTQAIDETSMLCDIQPHQADIPTAENTSAPASQPPPNTLVAVSPYTSMDSPTTPPGYMSEDGDNNDNLSKEFQS